MSEKAKDVIFMVILLIIALFLAGLAGWLMGESSSFHKALTLISLAGSVISIITFLSLILKNFLVVPVIKRISETSEIIVKRISESSEKTNRIILASSAASSSKSYEKFLDDFNKINKALEGIEEV